jgi:hypothetical protein
VDSKTKIVNNNFIEKCKKFSNLSKVDAVYLIYKSSNVCLVTKYSPHVVTIILLSAQTLCFTLQSSADYDKMFAEWLYVLQNKQIVNLRPT